MEIGVHGRLLAYGTMYKEEEGVSLTSWQIQSKAIFSRGGAHLPGNFWTVNIYHFN